MKKLLLSCVIVVSAILTGCKPGANGELVGTFRDRQEIDMMVRKGG